MTPEAGTLKIEAGKYYRTRDGRKVGPMRQDKKVWSDGVWTDGIQGWYEDGSYWTTRKTYQDLIAEWTDEPDTTKLWRDMTREEKKELLLAAHEGKVIETCRPGSSRSEWMCCTPQWRGEWAYRIRPEPKRETVTLYAGHDGLPPVPIGTIDLLDGKLDPGSAKIGPIGGRE
jgi:hypothetical protein